MKGTHIAMTSTTNKKLPVPKRGMLTLGCDPEFFFTTADGRTIGAEKIIPKAGLKHAYAERGTKPFVIIDGVQGEFNPLASTCRQSLCSHIRDCIRLTHAAVQTYNNQQTNTKDEVTINASPLVKLQKEELDTLDKTNQVFGCDPSFNAYGDYVDVSSVNPLKYLYRAAGGHIHIGFPKKPDFATELADKVVHMLDIICGNTCVLIDRHPGNKERRKLYGRAGDYRLPAHGLEYRTPSNFWLVDQRVASLVLGLVRQAVDLATDVKNGEKYYKAFTEAVDMQDIRKAINTNNFALAYRNFKKIQHLLCDIAPDNGGYAPLCAHTMEKFHFFVLTTKAFGLKYWFKDKSIVTPWVNNANYGFNEYLRYTVESDIKTLRNSATAAKEALPVSIRKFVVTKATTPKKRASVKKAVAA